MDEEAGTGGWGEPKLSMEALGGRRDSWCARPSFPFPPEELDRADAAIFLIPAVLFLGAILLGVKEPRRKPVSGIAVVACCSGVALSRET